MTIKYTKDHEWVKAEGDKATVGITLHAQDALGDVVFVDLPQVGQGYAQGEVAGVVEMKITEPAQVEALLDKTAYDKFADEA
jgi:glycine cleavage system H protein